MMVGRALEEETKAEGDRASTTTHPRPVLRVRGLTAPGMFAGVDLDVGAGEIVGLAGLVGAGRSELLETIFGLRSPSEGTVEVDGDRRTLRSPRHAIRNRIGFVPADRKTAGPRPGDERPREPRHGHDVTACQGWHTRGRRARRRS